MVDFPLPINPINQMLVAFADDASSDPTGEAFDDLYQAAVVIIAVAVQRIAPKSRSTMAVTGRATPSARAASTVKPPRADRAHVSNNGTHGSEGWPQPLQVGLRYREHD
jgi:hypothetical protein